MRVLDEHFQSPMKTWIFEDCLDPAKLKRIIAQERKSWNDQCMPQVEALMAAGWVFEMVHADDDPWQWAWRRPPRRANSNGMRFASTNQAYNALMREKPASSHH